MDKQKETTVPSGEKDQSSLKQTQQVNSSRKLELTKGTPLTYELIEIADEAEVEVMEDQEKHPELWKGLTTGERLQRTREIFLKVRGEFESGKRKLE